MSTVVELLRRDVADLDREVEYLTGQIEDHEEKIVALRHKREETRFRLAETKAAAEFLDHAGFRVERDAAGVVVVSISPIAKEPHAHD